MRVCGVRIDAIDADTATEEIIARAGRPASVHLCNAYHLSIATKEPLFAALLDRGDLNLPDGMPLVWIARRLGVGLADRAYGPDVMLRVLDRGRVHRLRHYLYGSTPSVIDALTAAIPSRFPGVDIVGAEPSVFRPLTPDDETALVARIREASPHVVWVGLGTPLQDHFVDRFRAHIDAPLVAVGAAFDFHAGMKRQAPRPIQRAGLEWAWRLASEPRRLTRRYLVGNTRFLLGARDATRLADRPLTR
jgi:N-acetylglucosaminyldiphosphoundecaprenol N-acetyl-beta-D-mannosaminyltransferase